MHCNEPSSLHPTPRRRFHRLLIALGFAIASFPGVAGAQEAPVAAVSPGAPAGTSLVEASESEKREAGQSFARGDEAFDVQRYQEALEHFRSSYGTVASPNSHLMIARSLLELGCLDEAYDEYQYVIVEAQALPGYQETELTAQQEQAALKSRLAWLTVELGGLPPGSALVVSERPRVAPEQEAELLMIAVNPGKTVVRATTPEGARAEALVHLAAGRTATVRLIVGETITVGDPPAEQEEAPPSASSPESPPASVSNKHPLRPWAIASGGVGLAGMGMFASFGILSTQQYGELEEACDAGRCPAGYEADIRRGRNQQTLANVGLGVGVAGLVTSAALFILDLRSTKHGPVEVELGDRRLIVRGQF